MTKEFSLLTQPIPSFPPNALSKIYSIDSDLQSRRYQFLIQKFQATYKRMPTFIARSPGRVNLIGEHVDYSGYSVMPMAIEKDVIMAFASFDPVSCEATIEIGNVDQRFPRRQFEHLGTKHCEIDSHEHEWSNYFKCGYKGVLDSVGYCTPKSIQIMMDGTVPAGGGLSSSSAFVCCSALVTMLAHNLEMDKGQLTKTAITGEQFAGVAIGGMDQSSSIMSLMGSALLIDFYPELDAQVVGLPDFKDFGQKPVFVIANTMVTANKHVTAPRNYNLRVVETRLAAAILVKHLKLKLKGIVTLKQVHEAQFGLEEDAVASLEKMVDVCKVFKNEPYSMREICKELELREQELRDTFIKGMVIEATEYKLKDRAIHVFTEAKRVYDFKQICSQASASINQLEQLGALMNASHSSCRDLFECSCTELDQLTTIATKNGAFGSRLTGAGWGGCCVSLLTVDKLDSFLDAIKKLYYEPRMDDLSGVDQYLFATAPSVGACWFDLK